MLGNCRFPPPQFIMPLINVFKGCARAYMQEAVSLMSTGRLNESSLTEQNFNKVSHMLHPPKLNKKKSDQRRPRLWVTLSAYTGF